MPGSFKELLDEAAEQERGLVAGVAGSKDCGSMLFRRYYWLAEVVAWALKAISYVRTSSRQAQDQHQGQD